MYLGQSSSGSDQADSEQVNIAQSRTDPHPLAKTGMVSGPPTSVNRLSVGPSTNSKVAKAIILAPLPSETSVSKSSRLEVISRSNQAKILNENPFLNSMNRSGILLDNGVRLTELIHICLLSQ